MKASELRIGNYIEGPEYMPDGSVNGKGAFKIKAKDFPYISEHEDKLNGVPLTEEWLVKLGFANTGKWYETTEGIIYSNNDFYIRLSKSTFKCCIPVNFFYSDFGKEINYVHQLQNLFFALCGHELEFK